MLSVVIPCQEDGFLVFPTLKSIYENEYSGEFEVLLVRTDHVDISESVYEFPVREYPGSFRNQAQATNWGIKEARGDVICVTKPGCIVAQDWLKEIDFFLQCYPSIEAVGGPVLPCLDRGTKLQKIASQIFHEEQRFPKSVAVPRLDSVRALLHATNSAYKRDVLELMKLDESFSYGYDFDACWRMLSRGYRLVFNPRMRVRYIFPPNLWQILVRYYVWGRENVLLKRRYRFGTGLKDHLHPMCDIVSSFLKNIPFVRTRRLLTFTQHAAFNIGSMCGFLS